MNRILCILGDKRTSDAHHCLKLYGLTTRLGRFEISFVRLAAERYVEARCSYASNCHYAFQDEHLILWGLSTETWEIPKYDLEYVPEVPISLHHHPVSRHNFDMTL